MKVYRIENKEGFGPYEGFVLLDHDIWSKWSKLIRPIPEDDNIGRVSEKHYYGFANLTDLCCWFTIKDRKKIKKIEFFITVYSIPDNFVKIGNKQVAFIKYLADKKEILDVLTFEKKEKI